VGRGTTDRQRSWGLLLAALALTICAAACDASTGTRGEACTRSAQCEPGLACIEGECSDDPAALGMQGEVPMLMPEQPDSGAAVTPDAAGPTDAAQQPPADTGAAAPPDAGAMTPADAGAMPPADAGSMPPADAA